MTHPIDADRALAPAEALAEVQALKADRDGWLSNAMVAREKWAENETLLETAEAEAARLKEALNGSVIAMKAARGVIVSKQEHALLTGALVGAAEALSGVALKGDTP